MFFKLQTLYLHLFIEKLKNRTMKKGIHPESYRTVIFKDFSCDKSFLGKSCAETKETLTWEDGNEYPLIKLEISNMSHPFFTGKMKFVDTAGRIEKFNRKYSRKSKVAPEEETPEVAPEVATEEKTAE